MTDLEKKFGLDILPTDGEHILVNAEEWRMLKAKCNALRRAVMSLGGLMEKQKRMKPINTPRN